MDSSEYNLKTPLNPLRIRASFLEQVSSFCEEYLKTSSFFRHDSTRDALIVLKENVRAYY